VAQPGSAPLFFLIKKKAGGPCQALDSFGYGGKVSYILRFVT